jgi:hypothetical protein
MGDRNAVPYHAAQQLMDRNVVYLADRVVERDVQCRLGLRVSLDGFIHFAVESRNVADILADQGRRQKRIDDQLGCLRCFAVARLVFAAPILQDLSRAEPNDATCDVNLDNDVIAPDWRSVPGPSMGPPDGQYNSNDLYGLDSHCVVQGEI